MTLIDRSNLKQPIQKPVQIQLTQKVPVRPKVSLASKLCVGIQCPKTSELLTDFQSFSATFTATGNYVAETANEGNHS